MEDSRFDDINVVGGTAVTGSYAGQVVSTVVPYLDGCRPGLGRCSKKNTYPEYVVPKSTPTIRRSGVAGGGALFTTDGVLGLCVVLLLLAPALDDLSSAWTADEADCGGGGEAG